MRICDCSSDVCSSDRSIEKVNISSKDVIPIPRVISGYGWSESNFRITLISVRVVDIEIPNVDGQLPESISRTAKQNQPADRKTVVTGKRVSVRVDLGCRLIITKKKQQYM